MKTVGVIGGLGPAATHDFFGRLLARTEARRDQDHLRILIDNNPHIPDRNAALSGEGPSPGPALTNAARGLQAAGADLIVMACNAAHAWESEIRAAITIPFLSMIEETVGAVRGLHPSHEHVGVLAADACMKAELYQSALARAGLRAHTLAPTDQAAFMNLIYRIKAGDMAADVTSHMRDLARRLIADGATAIIAGCTEVPLVLSPGDVETPLVSSTEALVERTVLAAGARLKPA